MNRDGHEYTYLGCDDWFIFSIRDDGMQCSVNTELSDFWVDLHESADSEDNAVEKYMLPRYQEEWDSICWKPDESIRTKTGCTDSWGGRVTEQTCSECDLYCLLKKARWTSEGKIEVIQE